VWTPKGTSLRHNACFELLCATIHQRMTSVGEPGEKIKIKKKRPYISRILPGAPLPPIGTNFGLRVRLVDVINCAKFYRNRLRSLDSVRGRSLTTPLDCYIAVNTVWTTVHTVMTLVRHYSLAGAARVYNQLTSERRQYRSKKCEKPLSVRNPRKACRWLCCVGRSVMNLHGSSWSLDASLCLFTNVFLCFVDCFRSGRWDVQWIDTHRPSYILYGLAIFIIRLTHASRLIICVFFRMLYALSSEKYSLIFCRLDNYFISEQILASLWKLAPISLSFQWLRVYRVFSWNWSDGGFFLLFWKSTLKITFVVLSYLQTVLYDSVF